MKQNGSCPLGCKMYHYFWMAVFDSSYLSHTHLQKHAHTYALADSVFIYFHLKAEAHHITAITKILAIIAFIIIIITSSQVAVDAWRGCKQQIYFLSSKYCLGDLLLH